MTITSKKRHLALAVLALAALAGAAAYRWWPRSEGGPPPVEPVRTLAPRPLAIVPGVYLLGRSQPAAVYAVETSDGLVLIDSGLEDRPDAVAAQLGELNLDAKRLRAILLTHVHADHSLGAAALRAQSGAKVYAGKADCAPLRAGGPRVAFFSTFYMPSLAPHPTNIDVELSGGETLEVGDAHFEVIAAPGHTPGSVCYLLQRAGQRILFTGDVVQALDPATENVLGTYSAYLAPAYRGDAADYLATLRRLRDVRPDLVLPGHPRMDATPQNPHLAPQRWLELLDRGIAAMEQLLARRQADGANFLDGTPRELRPGLHYFGDVGGRAVYVLDAPRGLLLFDAPGGTALAGLLESRFKALKWEKRKFAAVLLTSVDDAATSGLSEVLARHGCRVVAPKAGVDSVRSKCPGGTEIMTEDDLAGAGWFDGQPIVLRGRGRPALAYEFRWAGKSVLVSGLIPVKLSAETVRDLVNDVTGPAGGLIPYAKSLEQLGKLTPDLWLPAVPVHGQSANLYDRDWETVLENNSRLFLR